MKKLNLFLSAFMIFLSLFLMVACNANIYTISFELNGGSPQLESVEVLVGEKVERPENPTKDGYAFGGWYIDSGFQQEYNFDTKVNNSFTLHAKWNANKYSIFYNTNGGTKVDTSTFVYNTALKAPESPTKNGYAFEGWYVDEALTEKFDFSSLMPAYDLTLYAKWVANKYEVNFTSQGVEIFELKQLVDYNTNAVLPSEPTRTGYSFNGWLLNGIEYDFSKPVTKNITLAAAWKVNSYTISYNTLGGSEIASENVEFNQSLNQPLSPEKEGYKFAGWMLDGEEFTFDNAKMPAKDINLTAIWTANDYVISYNKNNELATGNTLSTDCKYDLEVALSENGYTLNGYTFVGWNTKADGSGTTYNELANVKNLAFSGIVELYAMWEANTYTIKFDGNGAAGNMEDQELVYDIKANLNKNTFEITGYRFLGWAESVDSDVLYADNAAVLNILNSGEITLYAKWEKISYVFTVKLNNGDDPIVKYYYYNDAIENILDPVYEGKEFENWYNEADNQIFTFENALMPASDLTIYAKWLNEYTISFNTFGGSTISSITGVYDEEYEIPSNPTKEGYEFGGWYSDQNLLIAYELTGKMPENNITLYAKWNINSYEITYDVNGGDIIASEQLEYNSEINKTATKTGYIFGGWYLDSEFNTKCNTMPAENITVYAYWTPITYKVSFNANGGTGEMAVQEFTYGVDQKLTKNEFSKTGYTFEGWALNATSDALYEDEFMISTLTATNNAEIVLYAIWSINVYTITFSAEGYDDVIYNDVLYGTLLSQLVIPQVSKVGNSYSWMEDGTSINLATMVTRDFNFVANFVKNTYNVVFVVNNKEVYEVEREYGAELDFSEYVAKLKYNMDILVELEAAISDVMNSVSQDKLMAFVSDTNKMTILATNYPNTYQELNDALSSSFANAMELFSICNTDRLYAESIYYSYYSNNGNPSMEGFIFGGWLLGESTVYEESITGDEYEGFVPASLVSGEKAYIIASFVGVDPIDDVRVDAADNTLIEWTAVNTEQLGFNSSVFDIEVKYEIYNKINDNEYVLIDTTSDNNYKFMEADTYSIPGKYSLVIKAIVTVRLASTGDIEVVLTSELADEVFDYLLSMSSNDLEVDNSGDYYYRGVDPDSDLTTFYFYTNMTYDFVSTNFVLTDKDGNLVDASEYQEITIEEGSEGNNSVICTTATPTAFYFKTDSNAEKVFYAKVLPYVSSFYFGTELSQYNSSKAGNSLFLNNESLYQIGAASTVYTSSNGYADYENNGFEFKLDIRTSGGEKIPYKNYSDYIVYKFYEYVDGQYVERTNEEMGTFNTNDSSWQFTPTSGRFKVEISIKEIYVARKLLEDEIIKPLEFEFELNNRVNVFTHEVLKKVYGNISSDFRNGINIHSNIIPTITELQKYTDEAAEAGNPFVGTLRDGSTVNVGMGTIGKYSSEVINKFSGNVYARVSSTDIKENYIISGNLFTIDGKKLPYTSIESGGNLSSVTGYKIANQQCAIFLYYVCDYLNDGVSTSVSKVNFNDISIIGNTTVPSLNNSTDAELESSLELMNRNSGGYLGLYISHGSDMNSFNTVIRNTTLAIKYDFGENNIVLDYFYTDSNWANAIFGQAMGVLDIRNSVIKNSGGAALHLEDIYSTSTQKINSYAIIDENTIIDNYVSGEEGYFKAYSLEFAVMQMKSQMESGVSAGTSGQYTMLKTITDPITGLTTQKVNFVMLSLPQNDNRNSATGSGKGQIGINVLNIQKDAKETYDYQAISALGGSSIVFNKYILNGGTVIPTEGILMSCNDIPGMGSAFIVAGVYLKS